MPVGLDEKNSDADRATEFKRTTGREECYL